MDDNDNPGRRLVGMRRTVDATCSVCGAAMRTRLRKDGDTGELVPERWFCSPRCRVKAYYENHKAERLEYQRQRRQGAARTGEEG